MAFEGYSLSYTTHSRLRLSDIVREQNLITFSEDWMHQRVVYSDSWMSPPRQTPMYSPITHHIQITSPDVKSPFSASGGNSMTKPSWFVDLNNAQHNDDLPETQSQQHESIPYQALPGLNKVINMATLTPHERSIFIALAPREFQDPLDLMAAVVRDRACMMETTQEDQTGSSAASNVEHVDCHGSKSSKSKGIQEWGLSHDSEEHFAIASAEGEKCICPRLLHGHWMNVGSFKAFL
jgi:hypothetical protein